jgi:transcriptional regulator with XRE-family HTH domain
MIEEIRHILNEKLKASRQNQYDICEVAGITNKVLSNFKNGNSDIKLSTLLKIIDVLGLEIKIIDKTVR